MLATKILASGITHLTDARYFAAWNVDYLCFPLGVEGGITLEYFLALREWVTGPECVAELGADAGAVPLDDLLRHGINTVYVDAGVDTFALRGAGIGVITRLPVAGHQSAEDLQDALAEFSGEVVLDFTAGGIVWNDLEAGHPFTTERLRTLTADRPVFLHIDLDRRYNGTELTTEENIYGLALRGSSEEKVGYKSFDELDDLIQGLEVFD